MTLYGLGVACFSPVQLYQLALDAGFPEGTDPDQGNAGTMAAIAMRESSGCPNLTNLRAPHTNGANDPGEHSYGLWQINVDTSNLLSWLGLTSANQLLDPVTNAQAAYTMWGGDDNNLNVAWYTQHPENGYRSRYLANLVAVQAALGTTGVNVPGLGDDLVPVTGGDTIISGGIVIAAIGAVALALFLERR